MDNSKHMNKYVFPLLSAAALTTTGICIHYLSTVHGMESLVLAFWRNILLALPLLLILECCFPKLVEIEMRDLSGLAIHGLILALFNFFWIESVRTNGTAVAIFLVYSSVTFSALLEVMLPGERLPHGKILAIIAILCTCFLISGALPDVVGGVDLSGIPLGLASGFCLGAYATSARYLRKRGLNSWTMIFYSIVIATVFLLSAKGVISISEGKPFIPAADYLSLGLSIPGWSVLLLLAIGPTLIGFSLYNVSLGHLPPGTADPFAESGHYATDGKKRLETDLIFLF